MQPTFLPRGHNVWSVQAISNVSDNCVGYVQETTKKLSGVHSVQSRKVPGNGVRSVLSGFGEERAHLKRSFETCARPGNRVETSHDSNVLPAMPSKRSTRESCGTSLSAATSSAHQTDPDGSGSFPGQCVLVQGTAGLAAGSRGTGQGAQGIQEAPQGAHSSQENLRAAGWGWCPSCRFDPGISCTRDKPNRSM